MRASTIHLIYPGTVIDGDVPYAFTVKHEAQTFIRRNSVDANGTVVTVRDGGGGQVKGRHVSEFLDE